MSTTESSSSRNRTSEHDRGPLSVSGQSPPRLPLSATRRFTPHRTILPILQHHTTTWKQEDGRVCGLEICVEECSGDGIAHLAVIWGASCRSA